MRRKIIEHVKNRKLLRNMAEKISIITRRIARTVRETKNEIMKLPTIIMGCNTFEKARTR